MLPARHCAWTPLSVAEAFRARGECLSLRALICESLPHYRRSPADRQAFYSSVSRASKMADIKDGHDVTPPSEENGKMKHQCG